MSGKRKRRWWSKKAEKEHERLRKEIADKKEKARSESEDRQQKIKVLWGLKKQDLKSKTYKERKENEQELKALKLKGVLDSVKKLTDSGHVIDAIGELVELALLEDREIEFLAQFRRDWEQIEARYPELLDNLWFNSFMAEAVIETQFAKRKPKEARKRTRRSDYKRLGGIGLIEYQFGGMEEADWLNKSWPSWPSALGDLPYEPRCLDDIFAGGEVHMDDSEGEMMSLPGLQRLFGMHRNRFPKDLPRRETGRETLYDWQAVVKIMKALLSEKTPMREKGVRGGSQRNLWPVPYLRVRVLQGIKERMNNISVPKDVKSAFRKVFRPYLPDSAK